MVEYKMFLPKMCFQMIKNTDGEDDDDDSEESSSGSDLDSE